MGTGSQAVGGYELEIEISGLWFFVCVQPSSEDNYSGLYALLVDPSHMGPSSGDHPDHASHPPHFGRAFVPETCTQNGQQDPGYPYRMFDLTKSVVWPESLESTPRYALPPGIQNLSHRTGRPFDRANLTKQVIVPLNFGFPAPEFADLDFQFVSAAGHKCDDDPVYLPWKFRFCIDLATDSIDLMLGETQAHLTAGNDKKIEIRLKNTTADFSHGEDIKREYKVGDAVHFLAHYSMLRHGGPTPNPSQCYPVLIEPPFLGNLYTCMPGGGS